MRSRIDKAMERFRMGYNCAQAVLYAHCEELGLDADHALRLATGLGAGIARRGGVCGAVSGGVLVLGFKHGRGQNEDRSATETVYGKAQELMTRFENRYGTCVCFRLLDGCDLSTAVGLQEFREKDYLNKVCRNYLDTVVRILEELL